MKVCKYTEPVARAQLEDAWPAGLREHAGTCETCADVARVTGWLSGILDSDEARAAVGLPDADRIWWRAKLLGRVEREQSFRRRAIQPVVVAERLMGLVAAAGVVAWAWTYRTEVLAFIDQMGVAELVLHPLAPLVAGALAVATMAVVTAAAFGALRDV